MKYRLHHLSVGVCLAKRTISGKLSSADHIRLRMVGWDRQNPGKDCSVLLFFISAESTLLCRILHVQYIVSFDDLPESPQTIDLTAEKTSNHVA